MTSIEERIVSLGFNNKSFEQHAAQSMSTLDKLDNMLNSLGGSKGVGLLTDTLETIANKFSVMGTIGDQVLRRIADGAMDVANKMIQVGKSMSVDQITAGWGKYEQKTASVQTIMNATGDSIEKVNEYLSDLMWYSDETSFGFTDMTAALGQMTSSGGKVENLIPLLMGVGNAVAYAGKGASEFSRVIYNLNQSYGAGALQLMDWKSLELAGVASKELKQALIDAAVAQGKIAKGDVTIANFSETLKKKWADTAVMEEAFGKFAEMTLEAKRLINSGVYRNATEAYQALASKYGEVAVKAAQSAQEAKSFKEAVEATQDAVSSGWLTTFEHIFGNYEEAKKLWTNLTDVLWEMFAAGAEMRNEVLERWHGVSIGGYQTLMEALDNLFEVITKLTNLTRGGLLKVILGSKGDDAVSLTLILVRATKAFKFFTDDLLRFTTYIERFSVIEKVIVGLRATFVALKVPISLAGKAIHEVLDPLFTYNGNAIKWPRDFALLLSQLATKFMDLGVSFNKWIRSSNVVQALSNVAWGLASVLELVVSGVQSFVDQLKTNFEPAVRKFRIDTLLDSLSKFGALLLVITSQLKESGALNTFVTILLEAFGLLGDIYDIVSIIVNSLLTTLLNKSGGVGNFINNILQLILKVITSIRGVLNGIIESGSLEGSIGGIGSALSGVFNILSNVVDFIANHNPFEMLASGIKKAGQLISNFAAKAKESLQSVFGTDGVLGEKAFPIAGGLGLAVLAIKKILTGSSIKKFVDNFNGLFDDGILGLLTGDKLGKTFGKTLDSVQGALNSFANGTNAKALKDVAIGIGILTASLLVLSLMDANKLAVSLLVVTAGLGELIGTLALLQMVPQKNRGVTKELLKIAGAALMFAFAVGTIAVATLIFAGALKVLSTIDPTALFTSLMAVIVILTAVSLALAVLSKYASGPKMLAAGASILAISVGILILTASLAALSFIPFDKLQNGMTALAVTLIIVGGAIALLSLAGAKALVAAGSIVIVSAAILALTAALVILAMIPGEALAKGLVMLAGSLVVMVAALLILSTVGPMALAAGGALLLLGAGVVMAAVGLSIMAGALRLMKPVKRDLPKIAVGLALIGASMLVLGAGGLVAGLGAVGFVAMVPLAFALSLLRGLELAKIAGGLALLGAAFIPLGLGGVALGLGSLGLVSGAIGLSILAMALPALAKGINAMTDVKLGTMLAVSAGLIALGAAGTFLMFGAAGMIVGAPALVALSEALPPLADGLNAFANVAWETIAKAGVILAEAIIAMFAVNVITLLHDGMPALTEFGEALPGLAEGINSFSDVNWDGIAKAGVSLGEAILAMLGVNTVTLLHDGTPSLKSFAETLPSISSGFKAFEEIDPELTMSVGKALGTTIKAMLGTGIASLIDGTPALLNLATALPVLATGFRAFEGLDPEWIKNTATSLAEAIKALTGDFFSNLFKNTPDYNGIASGIMQIALAVSSIPENANERIMAIGTGLMSLDTMAVETLNGISGTLLNIYSIVVLYSVMTIMAVQQESDSVLRILQEFVNEMNNIFDGMIADLDVVAANAYNAGVSIGQNLANGLWSMVSEVQAAADALRAAADAYAYADARLSNASQSRSNAPFGYKGMGTNFTEMYKQTGKSIGESFGNGVAQGTSSALAIHSPSRVFEQFGKYTSQGFANGLVEGGPDVSNGFDSVISPLLAAISSLMSEDLSPTITPVMDMTNVNAAASEFSDMFAATGTYAMAAAGRISANDRASRQPTVESNFVSGQDPSYASAGIVVNVYPSEGMDEKALADKVMYRISEKMQVRRAATGA